MEKIINFNVQHENEITDYLKDVADITSDTNINKCEWYKKELIEIHKFLKKDYEIDSCIKINIYKNYILLEINKLSRFSTKYFMDFDKFYKEIKNFFIEGNTLNLKIERFKNDNDIKDVEVLNEETKKHLKETSENIEIVHKWFKTSKNSTLMDNYNNTDFETIIKNIRYIIRKMNMNGSGTKITIEILNKKSFKFNIENLKDNVQLKDLFIEIESFLETPFNLDDIYVINTSLFEIYISITNKRKKEEEKDENKFKKIKLF